MSRQKTERRKEGYETVKENKKFIIVIVAIILCAILVLVGVMYAIGSNYGKPQDYDKDGISNIGVIDENDAPMSQEELRDKYREMGKFIDRTRTATVITEEYLRMYWSGNYEKEAVKSLSAVEVMYVIQDTINIVYNYDTIVLSAYKPDAQSNEVNARMPVLEEEVIDVSDEVGSIGMAKVVDKVVRYRITALSSPKTFISASDALRHMGYDPAKYFGDYPDSLFYIPGYSAKTNRDYLLEAFGDAELWEERKEELSYFTFMPEGEGDCLTFTDRGETDVLELTYNGSGFFYPTLETSLGGTACTVRLNLINGEFEMYKRSNSTYRINGTFRREGENLIFERDDGKADIIFKREGEHFVSLSSVSKVNLDKNMVFTADNDYFWVSLLDYFKDNE